MKDHVDLKITVFSPAEVMNALRTILSSLEQEHLKALMCSSEYTAKQHHERMIKKGIIPMYCHFDAVNQRVFCALICNIIEVGNFKHALTKTLQQLPVYRVDAKQQ